MSFDKVIGIILGLGILMLLAAFVPYVAMAFIFSQSNPVLWPVWGRAIVVLVATALFIGYQRWGDSWIDFS